MVRLLPAPAHCINFVTCRAINAGFRPIAGRGKIARMAERGTIWLASGFAAGLLLMGIPFWRLPYNHQGFTYPGLILGMIALGVVTAGLAAASPARLRSIFWTMLAAFPAAVAIRVAVEVAQDPTDHNLWPFEIVYALVVSSVAVVPGLAVGALVRKVAT